MEGDARSVWLLAEGEYSDYSIVGVYSTREVALAVKAEREKERRYCEVHDPEEWPLDHDAEHVFGPTYGIYIILESGELKDQVPRKPREAVRHPGRCRVTEPFGNGDELCIFVESPVSYEHAAKAAVEARQAWLRGRS